MADSILLVPHPEHREALLGDSPHGGRAPKARSVDCDAPVPPDGYIGRVTRWLLTRGKGQALVLRWRGVDDPMGCWRAADVMGTLPVGAVTTADMAERDGLGRIIRLDADGREVSDG